MSGFFPADEQETGSTVTLLSEPDGSIVRRTVLPSGLRVITEHVPGVRSATTGVWASVGSRDERTAQAGAAHFLEHLLFKGTDTRSALDISASLDAVGGELNAFTSKEYTCFYARTLGRDLPLALDVLLDVTGAPALRESDIDAERPVVLEEISMHEDDSNDRAYEAVQRKILGPGPLSLPILGTRDSIRTISPATIRGFFTEHYRPDNMTVAVAGDVQHAAVVQQVTAATADLGWDPIGRPRPLPRRAATTYRPGSGVQVVPWPGEQSTVTVATPGLPLNDDRRRALDVFNALMGGGMSSRLFQSIREERGLAYSVFSFHAPFSDAGVWGLSAGCNPERVVELLEVAQQDLRNLLLGGVTPAEVDRAKGHLSGGMVLAGEDTAARMTALGRAEASSGRLRSLDEALARVASVQDGDVMKVAELLLDQPRQVAVVGPATDEQALTASVEQMLVPDAA